MVLTFLNKHRHIGLLVLRIGIGCMLVFHGAPILLGGVDKWAQGGEAMKSFGIGFMPALWGFMAAISEFFGGICLIFGLLFRPACILMAMTMLVAAFSDLSEGEGLREAAHVIGLGVMCLSLTLIGAGKYSLDERFIPQQEEGNRMAGHM